VAVWRAERLASSAAGAPLVLGYYESLELTKCFLFVFCSCFLFVLSRNLSKPAAAIFESTSGL
jgi:hypothetical protein